MSSSPYPTHDGKIQSSRFTNKTKLAYLEVNIPLSLPQSTQDVPKLHFTNPIGYLRALFYVTSFPVILVGGMQYTIYECLATPLSILMIESNDLNYLSEELIHLPPGLRGVLAPYTTGELPETAKAHNLAQTKASTSQSKKPDYYLCSLFWQ